MRGWYLTSCYSLRSGARYDSANSIADTTHVQFSFTQYADGKPSETVTGVVSIGVLKSLLTNADILQHEVAA